MNLKRVTVIVEPVPSGSKVSLFQDGQAVPNPKSVHQFANYEGLVAEFRRRTSVEVTLIEGAMQVVPQEGIVILFPGCQGLCLEQTMNALEPAIRDTLSQRLVLLNVVRGEMGKLLGQYPLAAYVETLEYRNWWTIDKTPLQKQAMYGRTAVAKEIQAPIDFELDQVPYCYLYGAESERLPALLLRYLEAYARIVPGGLE